MESLPPPKSAKRSLKFSPPTEADSIQIVITPNGGACFGVVRAIKLSKQALGKNSKDPVFSFGPLIHNAKVVDELERDGLRTVNHTEEVTGGTAVLRSHGIPNRDEAQLRQAGIKIVDATCPLVKKPQKIAKGLGEKGYFLIVVGDANHPEVKGVVSYFERPAYLVTYKASDVSKIPSTARKIGVIAQTTIEYSVFRSVVEEAKKRFPEVLSFNTICDATSIRQDEAHKLSAEAEVMIVVGGKHSSNTSKLVKICRENHAETFHIETLEEIKPDWFRGKKRIGITGGASTPQEYVDQVGDHIAAIIQDSEAAGEA